jgi:hypothetical protein
MVVGCRLSVVGNNLVQLRTVNKFLEHNETAD